jgi:hypothetical protein
MIRHGAAVADSDPGFRKGWASSSWLLECLVDMTERAQRLLARCAEAEARHGADPFADEFRFTSDVTGGGSRCAEAARSLRASAGLQ